MTIEIGTEVPLKLAGRIVKVHHEDGCLVLQLKVGIPGDDASFEEPVFPSAELRVSEEALTELQATEKLTDGERDKRVLGMFAEQAAMDLLLGSGEPDGSGT